MNTSARSNNDFTVQNPHWEVDWITDRMRAYEKKCGSEPGGGHKLGTSSGGGGGVDSSRANAPLDIASISDQLMQMIAHANRQRNDSSEQQSSDSQDGDVHVPKKSKKSKKKKSKKKKKEEDIVPPAAIVKTSSRGKITINLPPVGGVSSRSPEEEVEDIATTLLKSQIMSTKKSKQMEDSPDGLYDNINLTIRGATAERQKNKGVNLLPASLSEYGDMNEDETMFKKGSTFDSPRREDLRYGPREPPRREKRTGGGSTSNNGQSHSKNSNSYRYEKSRGEYYGKERRDKEHYDYGYKDTKSPRSSKERHLYKEKKSSSTSKIKDSQKSPDPRSKQDRGEPERKLKMKHMLDKNSSSPEESAETVFEKRTSESAAKKKDLKKALPKSKLPFIGRMPILKKKVEQKNEEPMEEEKKQEEKPPAEVEFNLAEAMAKAEAAAAAVNQQIIESEALPLPKSTLIISKRPRLTEPEVVKKEAVLFKGKVTEDNLTEQDMDIEDEYPKDELHKDFKDALDLLFPEEKKKEDGDESGIPNEAATEVEGATGYDVHGMMAPQTATAYDMGMYHPPAAATPQVADQGQYLGYYDQSMYMHQAAYMMGGYDPSQAQAYATASAESNAQYLQQQQAVAAAAAAAAMPPPPMTMPSNGVAPPLPEQLVANSEDHLTYEADDQESTGEEDKDSNSKEGVPAKKKNPLSQRMRKHLKKKAEQARSKEDQIGVEESEPEPPPPPSIKGFTPTVDKSDLAMLGIEEDDITAQSFV